MDLDTQTMPEIPAVPKIPERILRDGIETVTLAAGKKLEIKTKTPVATVLEYEVPPGKTATIVLRVTITEA